MGESCRGRGSGRRGGGRGGYAGRGRLWMEGVREGDGWLGGSVGMWEGKKGREEKEEIP